MIEVVGAAASASDRAWLAERLTAALALLSAKVAELRVRVVDDQEMTRLHERSLGKRTTTDVLSWVSESSDGVEIDVAICVDEADRRAHELNLPRRDELLLYAVHGLLHGIGHDDTTPEAFRRMHTEEARIMDALGAAARVDADLPPASGDRGRA